MTLSDATALSDILKAWEVEYQAGRTQLTLQEFQALQTLLAQQLERLTRDATGPLSAPAPAVPKDTVIRQVPAPVAPTEVMTPDAMRVIETRLMGELYRLAAAFRDARASLAPAQFQQWLRGVLQMDIATANDFVRFADGGGLTNRMIAYMSIAKE